jgi:molecular chaperone GrpE
MTDPTPDAEARLTQLEAELNAALERAEQHRESHLRLAAELDNLRRRTQREIEAERRAALERCVAEFLPVKDGLELGLAASSGSGDGARLVEGMDATLRLFGAALERLGVEELDPLGKAFDADLHEAMVVQPSAEHPEGTVLAVVQRGYRIAGRVIRPARVVVSRRPADAAAEPPAGPPSAPPGPGQDGLF